MHCSTEAVTLGGAEPLIILAGQPNVGKSVLFKRLTGRYAAVSNYPGTTVEITKGESMLGGLKLTVIDAPGINSLQPEADDERVTRSLLLNTHAHSVVQVADAKNLSRALFLTLQLGELGVPLVLALNMADEAHRKGVRIDAERLAERLETGVVLTVATSGQGVDTL